MQILQELIATEQPLTSEYLANVAEVTSRTIREDVKTLDHILVKHGACINSLKGKGYQLVIENDLEFRNFLNDEIKDETSEAQPSPDLPEDRIQYLIRRFLLAENYLKLDDLADEMHISKSTIQNDIRQAKKIIDGYGVTLEKRPNYGLKVKGSEVKLRYAVSEFVFNRNERVMNMVIRDQLAKLIDEESLQELWTTILAQIKSHGITLSDIAVNNLFIHMVIAYRRIKSGHHVSIVKQDLKEIIDKKEYEVAKQIVEKAEGILQVTYPAVEVAYIAIHLLGTKMIRQSNMSEQEIGKVMEADVYELTTAALDLIEEKLNLNIRHDRELIIALGLHLKPAINRFRYGMNIRNPMLEDIKANYALAFEAGIIAGIAIEEQIGVKIDENEIGYLALHIGAAIERSKLNKRPTRCMIVCASGLGSAQLIKYKIQSKFGGLIEIAGTTEYYKLNQLQLDDVDLVISSIPIQENLSAPVIEVNTILGEKDLDKIEKHILGHANSVTDYIKEDRVFLNQKFESKDEVLTFIYEQLKAKDIVEDGFLDAVYKREAIAPTAFGNLTAIPHPITPQTDHTFISICTLDKPILWEDKRVQFVCLLCVEKNSSEDLQNMYAMLTKIVENPSLIQQLLKCKSYNEMISILIRSS